VAGKLLGAGAKEGAMSEHRQGREVACVFVGMAEVSSCRIVALPGQHVDKGDELGYFQYGGSTWCAVVRPGVIDTFVPQSPYRDDGSPIRVNAHLATAKRSKRSKR